MTILEVLRDQPAISLEEARAIRKYIDENTVGEALMYLDWSTKLYERLELEIRDAHVLPEFVDHAVDIRRLLETIIMRITDYYNTHPGDIEGIIKDREVAFALLLSAPETMRGETITKLQQYTGDAYVENEDYQDWIDYVDEMRKYSSPGSMKIAFKKLPKLKNSNKRMSFHRME